MKEKQDGRGGAREGAGRKKVNGVRYTLRLSSDTDAKLREHVKDGQTVKELIETILEQWAKRQKSL